jgi:hypothetical protein
MSVIDHPPTHYSVWQPDYTVEIGARLRIFVDGVEQQQVVEYDCRAGTVVKNATDQDGHPMLNAKRDAVLRAIVRGLVTVEWKD